MLVLPYTLAESRLLTLIDRSKSYVEWWTLRIVLTVWIRVLHVDIVAGLLTDSSEHHWHLSVSRDHRFAPIVQRLLWLWRPVLEWQSLPHLEHVKDVVGLLARHRVFLWSLFSSPVTCCVSSYCDNPTFTVCLQASLFVAVTFQELVFISSSWRSLLHTSLKRS